MRILWWWLVVVVVAGCGRETVSPVTPAPESHVAAPPSLAECQGQAAHWLDAFAWKSPVTAYNRSAPWPIVPSEIAYVFEKQFKTQPLLSLPQPLFMRNELGVPKKYELFPFKKFADKNFRNRRDRRLYRNIEVFLSDRQPGELKIVWAGAGHGQDAFFHYRERLSETAFVHYRIRNESELHTPGYYRLREYLTGKKLHQNRGIDLSAPLHLGLLGGYAAAIEEGVNHLTPAQLLDTTKPTSLDRIVLLDAHYVRETSHIDRLPTAACLPLLGYRKIHVAMEEMTKGSEVTERDLARTRGFKGEFDDVLSDPARARDFAEQYSAEALRVLRDENTDAHPALGALIDKLKTYESHIEVHYEGLE
jgi:hypothetical protein